jgi:GntR family transcriptional regulator
LLPSEFDLTRTYNVSRITAKRALDELAAANMVVREQGRGTLVRNNMRKRAVHGSVLNLAHELKSPDWSHTIKGLSWGVVDGPPEGSDGSTALAGERVRCIKRVLSGPEGPTSYVAAFVRLSIARSWSKSMLSKKSLAVLFEEAGIVVATASEKVASVAVDAAIASQLSLKKGAPVLRVERMTYDRAGKCIDYVEAIHRSDRYEYSVDLRVPA